MDPRVAFRHQVKYAILCIIPVIVFCVPEKKRERGQNCWLASAEAFCRVAYSWNHHIWKTWYHLFLMVAKKTI